MKKPKPKPKLRPGQKVNPGGPMQAAPAPRGHHHHHAPAPKPGAKVNPGGPVRTPKPAAHVKPRRKKPKKAPPRKLALGEGVACCAAEALAASLRLTGWHVSDADVLALYLLTADDPDAGATIWETLEAAAAHGLAGARPANWVRGWAEPHLALTGTGCRASHQLILGVDLPGSHAVLATPDGWWSWGELHDPAAWPDAIIDEAWEVTW